MIAALSAVRNRLTRIWPVPDTTPRIEPVDPPTEIPATSTLATPPGPVVVCDEDDEAIDPRLIAAYRSQPSGAEQAVLDSLADRIAGGMSPLEAAQARFGGGGSDV